MNAFAGFDAVTRTKLTDLTSPAVAVLLEQAARAYAADVATATKARSTPVEDPASFVCLECGWQVRILSRPPRVECPDCRYGREKIAGENARRARRQRGRPEATKDYADRALSCIVAAVLHTCGFRLSGYGAGRLGKVLRLVFGSVGRDLEEWKHHAVRAKRVVEAWHVNGARGVVSHVRTIEGRVGRRLTVEEVFAVARLHPEVSPVAGQILFIHSAVF